MAAVGASLATQPAAGVIMEFAISLTCLAIIVAISGIGLYYSKFKDNLFQCLGMIGLAFWAMSEMSTLVKYEHCNTSVLLHVALALYFMGTAAKVVAYARRDRKREVLV